MLSRITIIVLTHNDELRIVDCLEAVRFADELIIIDDNSTDRTVELAKQYTEKIFIRDLGENFANQRNFALNQVHNEWVFFVDSDEIVSDSLRDEILNEIKSGNANGYFIRRIDYMWGNKILHGEAGEVKLLRLAKKGHGKWRGKVHETWRITGEKKILQTPLIHLPHQSVRDFVKEVDEYSDLRSNELLEAGTKVTFLDIFIYPTLKFIVNYLVKKGYKDGIPGFIYAVIMSFHSFLVRGKIFLNNKKIR